MEVAGESGVRAFRHINKAGEIKPVEKEQQSMKEAANGTAWWK